MNIFKDLLYRTVKQDSRNMEKVGDFFNWEWLQEEAKRNQQDPSKALRKAAISAASIYGGGLLGGAGAAAGANAAGQVAGQAATQVGSAAAQQAAQEAAILAAQEAAKQGAVQGAQSGILSGTSSIGPAASSWEYGGLLNGMNPTMAKGLGYADRGLDMMAGKGGGSSAMQGMNMASKMMTPPPPAPPPPRPQQSAPMPPPPSGYGAPLTGSGALSGLPPELAGLPPNDPRVIAFMRSRGM